MHTTLDAVVQLLLARGYKPGRPPWVSPEEAAADREICGLSRCTFCGKKGLEYHPFHRAKDRSYRVAAVCFSCDHAREAGDGAPVEVMRLPASACP